ncbi:Thioesterase, related [Eimeria tenella]|uniref:Thioesterase, related n=1 Tax=Eimeria tenella TaxID=5802 RepID=U6KQE8_EIMTE|nr:Thioesterase, related [Eimeria tenella]CDJ37663.1 Thioesterase, related [Eimeria tenella]|eukprot:XP_013228501.1 Thioesterase, related [Eimeria tenella]
MVESRNPVDEKWFPRAILPQGEPKLRVFCFPGAGMEASIWTGRGTSLSRMPNPLCDFAQKEGVAFLALQMPFRGLRRREAHPRTLRAAAAQALDAMRPLISKGCCPYVLVGYSMGCWLAFEVLQQAKLEALLLPLHFVAAAMVSPDLPPHRRPWTATAALDTAAFQISKGCCPYVLVGYSMGCWLAFEVLQQAKLEALLLPLHFVAAAMVSPDLPPHRRPWTATAALDTAAFQNQLRQWNCNEVLFQKDMWAAYEPLLRADHNMLDEYQPTDLTPLDIPCSVFRGSRDLQLADNSLFEGWFRLLRSKPAAAAAAAAAGPQVQTLDGDHGLVFDPNGRKNFFNKIVEVLDGVLLAIEYGQ